MSDKSGNEIQDAYMEGLFEGEKRILIAIKMLMDDLKEERRKQMEAHE